MKKIAIALMASGFAAAALAAPPTAEVAPANDMAPAATTAPTTAPAKKASKKAWPKKKTTTGKATAAPAATMGADGMATPADAPASAVGQ